MVGRVSFVILSGIVAAAALVHVLPKDNSADLAGGAKIVPQIVGAGELNADVGTHEAVVVAMDRVEMSQLRALEKAVAEAGLWDRPGVEVAIDVVRATPEVAAGLVTEAAGAVVSAPSVLGVIEGADGSCAFKGEVVAVADLRGGKVVEATDDEKARAVVPKLRAHAAQSGVLRHVEDGALMLAVWTCKDASMAECVVVDKVKPVPLPAEFACQAAEQTYLTCDNAMPDTVATFQAADCVLDGRRAEIAHALAGQVAPLGTFEFGGQAYRYRKTMTKSNCEVATALAESAVAASEDVQSGARQALTDGMRMGLGVCGGVVFALIVLVCTRRRKEGEPEVAKEASASGIGSGRDSGESVGDVAAVKAQLEAERAEKVQLEAEKAALETRIERLEHESEIQKQDATQLKEQLEYAKTAFKKEQILRMSLAEENTRLEDAVASVSPGTVVDRPVNSAMTGGDDAQIKPVARVNPISAKASKPGTVPTPPVVVSESQRITKNAELSVDDIDGFDKIDDFGGIGDVMGDAFSGLGKSVNDRSTKDIIKDIESNIGSDRSTKDILRDVEDSIGSDRSAKDILRDVEDGIESNVKKDLNGVASAEVLNKVIDGDSKVIDGDVKRVDGEKSDEKTESRNIFDAMTDDGWDEIADSFDSIIAPSKAVQVGAKSPFDLLEGIEGDVKRSVEARVDDANEESGFGMTGFLNAIKTERRQGGGAGNPHVDTETRLKSVQELPKLSSIPKISTVNREVSSKTPTSPGTAPTPKGLSSLANAPKPPVSSELPKVRAKKTLSGIASVAGPNVGSAPVPSLLERQVAPSARDLAMRNPSEKKEESFKPAPSWSGKSVQDAASVDNNTLYDALKRRAKDVSQMNLPSAPSASGDFEFNRGLSKSGVFSLTGSRVDIDPMSDNECFKQLYTQYIETQKQCGEDTNKFTLEQFVSRLAREKDRLVKRYNCKNVKFSVYIKDGKTSLKATPQK